MEATRTSTTRTTNSNPVGLRLDTQADLKLVSQEHRRLDTQTELKLVSLEDPRLASQADLMRNTLRCLLLSTLLSMRFSPKVDFTYGHLGPTADSAT
jgi:hypothetical protein